VLWSQTARTGCAPLLARLSQACPCPVLAAGPGWTRQTAGNVRVLLDLRDAVRACADPPPRRPARRGPRRP
jgi:hypothetical protein